MFNYDQSGFGSSKDALYVEPDDVPANRELVTLVRSVMTDHVGEQGFPAHAASVKTQGGTDSYVFQPRAQGATVYPAVTLVYLGLGQGTRVAGHRGVPAHPVVRGRTSPGW